MAKKPVKEAGPNVDPNEPELELDGDAPATFIDEGDEAGAEPEEDPKAEKKYRVLTQDAIIDGNMYDKPVDDEHQVESLGTTYGAVMLSGEYADQLLAGGVALGECEEDDNIPVTTFEAAPASE